MTRLRWLIQVVSVGFLWTCFSNAGPRRNKDLDQCFKAERSIVVGDNFYGIINASHWNKSEAEGVCIIFLQTNKDRRKRFWKKWPQMEMKENSHQLYLPKYLAKKNKLSITCYSGNCTNNDSAICKIGIAEAHTCDSDNYDDASPCKNASFNDKYMINMTEEKCTNCDNPVKEADEEMSSLPENLNITLSDEGEVDASQAVALIENLDSIISQMKGTSASLSLGGGIKGILVKETEPEEVEEVSFAYRSSNDSMKIIEEKEKLDGFSRTVTVSKEAFEKALGENKTEAFAAVFRFLNMTKDELNSTILGNEVVAIDMGAVIKNLTDTISIHFKKFEYEGNPQCRSWDGAGNKPNWTDEGCETIRNGCNITCRCTHLTFFAVLLTPINETISSSHLNKLTIISQVGCGLSMFFLSILFFMHFLLRKTKAGNTTRILIQLAMSMFLLNLTFLINNYVAALKSSAGCTIMAALMHYFMLSTFSWFAVQAFHFWLQLYKRGRILIQHYILKISVLTWFLPSIVAIVLIISRKYGEQIIYTDNPEHNVAMCWITDNNVHYVVNIGYYVLVFLITFSTACFILSTFFCLKKAKMSSKQGSQNGKDIVIFLGLCCVLGITWGFAFLAYGPLRLPGVYIFTILNSFQGFFLFIYYYNSNHSGGTNASEGNNLQSTSSTSTLKTILETFDNPYIDSSAKEK